MQHQIDVITGFSICKFCVISFHQRPQGCAQDDFSLQSSLVLVCS